MESKKTDNCTQGGTPQLALVYGKIRPSRVQHEREKKDKKRVEGNQRGKEGGIDAGGGLQAKLEKKNAGRATSTAPEMLQQKEGKSHKTTRMRHETLHTVNK